MFTTAATTPASSGHTVSHYHALCAFEALGSGPIFTLIHDNGATVSEEIDWVHTSPTQRRWLVRPAREARLLIGLHAASALGLVRMQLTLQPGDAAAYRGRWERKA